jgi:hypothetical protein
MLKKVIEFLEKYVRNFLVPTNKNYHCFEGPVYNKVLSKF